MNANPQAAAEQARKTYRDMAAQLGKLGLDTAIPEGVRALAEKTWRKPVRPMIALWMLSIHP